MHYFRIKWYLHQSRCKLQPAKYPSSHLPDWGKALSSSLTGASLVHEICATVETRWLEEAALPLYL